MDIYRINISSEGNGWRDNVRTEGKISESDGCTEVKYTIDGDECTLTHKNGKVIQQRLGSQNVFIVFEQGRKTCCTFGSGGFSGSYELTTHKLNFINGKGGIKLYLEYSSGSDNELIHLTFTAVKNSWGMK